MKHNKDLPVYFSVTPVNENGDPVAPNKICATYFGVASYIRDSGVIFGEVHSVQKDIDGIYKLAEGRSKLLVHGRIRV